MPKFCTQNTEATTDVWLQLEVVVSVPLALSLLLPKKRVKLDCVQYLVLDETDKLLEVNKNPHSVSHVHQVDKIMKACTHADLVGHPYPPPPPVPPLRPSAP